MATSWNLVARRLALASCALLLAVVPAQAQDAKGKKSLPLTARCDREDAIYKVGEKATFLVSSITDGEASYSLSEAPRRCRQSRK